MKKNVMMRLASVLLIAVLISTSAISGTYAKYVTDGEGHDVARVAKFGVKVEGFDGMFATEYETHETDYVATVGANSVISSSGENLVAPGTSGKMTEIRITGTPEVAVRVNYEVTKIELEGWEDKNGAYYCPIIIDVCGTKLDGQDYDDADAFKTAITNLVAGYTKSYEANQNLEDVQAENMDISWEWPFTTGAENDVKDTYLGDQAAADNAATIELTVTCTVTQID